ncbi:hypothetical protein LCGC14_2265190, partial [marine sediment metagenome]
SVDSCQRSDMSPSPILDDLVGPPASLAAEGRESIGVPFSNTHHSRFGQRGLRTYQLLGRRFIRASA